jgi:hypothetical protein
MGDFNFFKYHVDPNDQKQLDQQLLLALGDTQYPFDAIKEKIGNSYSWNKIAEDLHSILKTELID